MVGEDNFCYRRWSYLSRCVRSVCVILLLWYTSPLADEKNDKQELQCLATAIFHEARGENLKGKRAVLDTIVNRSLATGKSFCQIISAPRQFSWYTSSKMKSYSNEDRGLLEEVLSHRKVLNDEKFFYSGKAPVWTRKMKCRKIGNHNFCNER